MSESDLQSELARRGLMVKSIRFDEPRLHVVAASWLTEKLPMMDAELV